MLDLLVPHLNVFLTDEGRSWSVVSPQLPELVYGRPTSEELRHDLKDVLAFAGAEPGLRIDAHHQTRGQTPHGDEFLLRYCLADRPEQRREVINRMSGILTDRRLAGQIDETQLETDPMGVLVFVGCLPSDTLGWLADQLDPREDVLTIVTAVADQMVFTTQLARSDQLNAPSLADRGWDLETTVGELMTDPTLVQTDERMLLKV